MPKRVSGRKGKKAAAPDLVTLTRRVLLAGIGALALAHDEIEAFLDRLVERGELAREQAQEMLKEIAEKREGRAGRVREQVRSRVAEALSALDVPTRRDLEALQTRLDRLTERLEALLAREEKAG